MNNSKPIVEKGLNRLNFSLNTEAGAYATFTSEASELVSQPHKLASSSFTLQKAGFVHSCLHFCFFHRSDPYPLVCTLCPFDGREPFLILVNGCNAFPKCVGMPFQHISQSSNRSQQLLVHGSIPDGFNHTPHLNVIFLLLVCGAVWRSRQMLEMASKP